MCCYAIVCGYCKCRRNQRSRSTGCYLRSNDQPVFNCKEGRDFVEVVKEITSIVDGPISVEVISLDHGKMVEEALELAKIHKILLSKSRCALRD